MDGVLKLTSSSAIAQDGGAPSENTPLIGGVNDLGHGAAKPDEDKPLPKLQMFLLCYTRVMEPIAFFCIFPFVPQMVQRNGNLPETDVGFYSGLIECIFSITQMQFLIVWGRLADRIGRKPVLLVSIIGTAIFMTLFGFSTSILQMMIFRSGAGIMSGSSLIIRTMIGDHVTPKTQARAFSWFAFAGNIGIFLGPLIGGALADPVKQYPKLFQGNKLFKHFPYALPGLVVGAINMTAALAVLLFLKETLKRRDPSESSSGETQPPAEAMSMWTLVKSKGVIPVLFIYSHVMLLAFAFTALFPLALYTPISLGGFSASPAQISIVMAAQGASQALWLLLIFPPLQHRFGTKGSLRVCAIAYPIFFILYPILNGLLREGSKLSMNIFWVLGAVVCFVGPGVAMAFTGVQLSLNEVSPNPQVLGTLNAICMTLSSGVRSIIPGITTAVFAIGVKNNILWGHLMWAILVPVSAVFLVALRWHPDDKPRF